MKRGEFLNLYMFGVLVFVLAHASDKLVFQCTWSILLAQHDQRHDPVDGHVTTGLEE